MWPNLQETFTEEILNEENFIFVQWIMHSYNINIGKVNLPF